MSIPGEGTVRTKTAERALLGSRRRSTRPGHAECQGRERASATEGLVLHKTLQLCFVWACTENSPEWTREKAVNTGHLWEVEMNNPGHTWDFSQVNCYLRCAWYIYHIHGFLNLKQKLYMLYLYAYTIWLYTCTHTHVHILINRSSQIIVLDNWNSMLCAYIYSQSNKPHVIFGFR